MGISGFVTPDSYLLVEICCVCSTNRDRRHVAETLRFTQHGQERDSTERAWSTKMGHAKSDGLRTPLAHDCDLNKFCVPTWLLGLGQIKTNISWWRYKKRRRRSSGHKIWSVIDDLQRHHFETGQEARNDEKLWTARRDRLSMWHVHFSRMPNETDWEDEAQVDVKYQNWS